MPNFFFKHTSNKLVVFPQKNLIVFPVGTFFLEQAVMPWGRRPVKKYMLGHFGSFWRVPPANVSFSGSGGMHVMKFAAGIHEISSFSFFGGSSFIIFLPSSSLVFRCSSCSTTINLEALGQSGLTKATHSHCALRWDLPGVWSFGSSK